MEGRIIGNIVLSGVKYQVREHSEQYQPPLYIRDLRALCREVRHNESNVLFYAGKESNYRVSFQFNGVWCYIPPYGNRNKANPQTRLMTELGQTFEFSADDTLVHETINSPFRR